MWISTFFPSLLLHHNFRAINDIRVSTKHQIRYFKTEELISCMALHEGGFRCIMLYPTPKLVAITSNLFVPRHALMPQGGEGDTVLELNSDKSYWQSSSTTRQNNLNCPYIISSFQQSIKIVNEKKSM